MRPDIRFFRRLLGWTAVAAVVADLSGALVTSIVRQVASPFPGIADRIVFVVVAGVAGGAILSKGFAGRVLATPESVAATVAAAMSLWLGPGLYSTGRSILGLAPATNDPGLVVSAADVAWTVGMLLVMVPLEGYVWLAWSPRRVRTIYRAMYRDSHDQTAIDPEAAASVRTGLRELERQRTPRSAALADAVTAWYEAWLAHPAGMTSPFADPYAERIETAMDATFGPRDAQTM